MNLSDRETFLLHARLAGFKRKLAEAEDLIGQFLIKSERPYVAFSGGKCSTVSLHLTRSIAPDIPAQFGHEEWVLPETLALVDATPNVIKTALRDRHAEFFVAWEQGKAKLPSDVLWVDTEQYSEFDYHRKMLGFDGCLLGLRADESVGRRFHLRKNGPLYYCKKHGVWECNPLAWWSTRDVWAYIVSREVSYNAAYDKLAEMGVDLEYQRVGPIAVDRVLSYGQAVYLHRGWPELWNRLAAEFPMIRKYA